MKQPCRCKARVFPHRRDWLCEESFQTDKELGRSEWDEEIKLDNRDRAVDFNANRNQRG